MAFLGIRPPKIVFLGIRPPKVALFEIGPFIYYVFLYSPKAIVAFPFFFPFDFCSLFVGEEFDYSIHVADTLDSSCTPWSLSLLLNLQSSSHHHKSGPLWINITTSIHLQVQSIKPCFPLNHHPHRCRASPHQSQPWKLLFLSPAQPWALLSITTE